MDIDAYKRATTEHELIASVAERWSPRSFSDRPVTLEELETLFEAARWAPSSMNEQPWRFVYGLKGSQAFEKLQGCLLPGNETWAKNAASLIAVVGKPRFDYKDRVNRTWQYDLGLAVGNLMNQATAMGLSMHQMGGVDLDTMKSSLNIPDNLEPLIIIAVGYRDEPSKLPEDLEKRELSKRTRIELKDLVFEGQMP